MASVGTLRTFGAPAPLTLVVRRRSIFAMRSVILRTTSQFSIVGPLVGGALYFVPMVLLDRAWIHTSAIESAITATFIACVMFSYLFGLVPAALTGALLGTMRHNKSQSTWAICAALVGLLVGGTAGACIDIYNTGPSGSFLPTSAAFIGAPSCISALVCSYIFRPIAS